VIDEYEFDELRATMNPTLTVLVGLPGSGKTHWAREKIRSAPPGLVARVNRDSLRDMLHIGVRRPGNSLHGIPAAIEKQAAAIVLSTPGTDRHVFIDDTNLKPATLDMWRELAASVEAEFMVLSFLDIPVGTCIERDARRLYPVGEQVIREMNDVWVPVAQQWIANLDPDFLHEEAATS
jgi:predicted kinase